MITRTTNDETLISYECTTHHILLNCLFTWLKRNVQIGNHFPNLNLFNTN